MKDSISSRSGLLLVVVTAFLSRLIPLSASRYPFNNDSLSECGMASEIISTGHLSFSSDSVWFGTHSVATPIFNSFIAFASEALGVTPLQCSQILIAALSAVTVGVTFLLGRLVSGSALGGLCAAFAALMLGTFVFTTASVWKESLGMSLFLLAVLGYVLRGQLPFRILWFSVLMIIPLVHHLVAGIAVITFAYLLTWSLYFAFSNGVVKKRHVIDLAMVSVPTIWVVVYYWYVSLDRASVLFSPSAALLLLSVFALLSLSAILVLSLRNHIRWTFSPIVGASVLILFILDYSGFVFPYTSSASIFYLVLGLSFAFLLSLAWYGAEMTLEKRPVYRAIQVVLAVSPLSVMLLGLLDGLSLSAHQILFRSFDFIDIFIFLGVGVTLSSLSVRRFRTYLVLGISMIVALAASFPFAYYSADLLGVRHDTQAYEVDALQWIVDNGNSYTVVSDERVAHIANSLFAFSRNAYLPYNLKNNIRLDPGGFYFAEDRWTTDGVNDYPYGLVVLPLSNYSMTLQESNVLYVGGPAHDHAVLFLVPRPA